MWHRDTMMRQDGDFVSHDYILQAAGPLTAEARADIPVLFCPSSVLSLPVR